MSKKTKVAIIGTGNIGCDLLLKIRRSPVLECSLFAGRNLASKGMQLAARLGVTVSDQSIHAIEDNPDCCDIVFDATSAEVHRANAPILKALGKFAIDLTPAAVGIRCVPAINLQQAMNTNNVNLITCGGQASIPIAYAISQVQNNIKYCELVASIASKSAGLGTRNNIDEFTQTTRKALAQFTGIPETKAIIILNPAEPPIIMRNTLYMIVDDPDMQKVTKAVNDMVECIKEYVPGYKLRVPPLYKNGYITTTIEVTGRGDYLPEYSGNLDIITSAAIRVAEAVAEKKNRSADA